MSNVFEKPSAVNKAEIEDKKRVQIFFVKKWTLGLATLSLGGLGIVSEMAEELTGVIICSVLLLISGSFFLTMKHPHHGGYKVKRRN